ncbi:MAG TPA: outer membrane protein assembly factor BamE [Geminicoccaceae bacterium]|nr:outer membrane protein assembly factor BamE [Geminicoccaceae bacterium]
MAGFGQGRRHVPPRSTIAVAAILTLAACTSTVTTHGHRLDAAALAQIEPGQTSQNEVVQLLGSPSSIAAFDDRTWYYVSQRIEKSSFYHQSVVAQDVVAIGFDDQGTVNHVDRHDLNGAREIDPVDRETPTAGNELSIFEQFIGNIGRFNPPDNEE